MAHSMAALFKASSSAAADQIVADVEGGSLWGVAMGTTSKAAAYGEFALVAATNSRMHALDDLEEPDADLVMLMSGIDALTNRSDSEIFWSLLGAAEAE